MDIINIVGILILLGIVSLLFYVIFAGMLKKRKLRKINAQEVEMIRAEKEIDNSDALKKGLHILHLENKKKEKSD